jgi:hypothetical protein
VDRLHDVTVPSPRTQRLLTYLIKCTLIAETHHRTPQRGKSFFSRLNSAQSHKLSPVYPLTFDIRMKDPCTAFLGLRDRMMLMAGTLRSISLFTLTCLFQIRLPHCQVRRRLGAGTQITSMTRSGHCRANTSCKCDFIQLRPGYFDNMYTALTVSQFTSGATVPSAWGAACSVPSVTL